MAKYVIDIPDEKIYAYVNEDKTFLRVPISAGENNIKSVVAPTMLRITPYTEPDEDEIRQKVEQEVWEFARRIICPSDCCEDSISKYTEKFLGIPSHKARAIFKDLSYQEVKAKYDAWKKQKDEIRVGDEVELFEGVKGLVYIVGEEMLEGAYLNCDGLVSFCWKKKDCRKTGKHFDDIEELLKKMREE